MACPSLISDQLVGVNQCISSHWCKLTANTSMTAFICIHCVHDQVWIVLHQLGVANMARTRPSWQIWLDVYLLVSSRKKGVPIKGKYDNKVVAKFLQVVKWYRAKFCKR